MSDRKSRKSFPKTILITLILVVLIAGGYFAIRSNLAKNKIKNQIISTMENAIDRGIYIGKVKDYSLSSITLSDFKVFKNRSLLDDDQIFEAEEVIVNYDLDFLSALKREIPLSVGDITLIKPRMTLIRDSQGIFDFMEKFNFLSDNFAVSLKRVNFQDGNLNYIDYQTTKESGLLTKVKSLNGYFYLENLPKVEFVCSGLREEDNAPLTLKGYFFAGRVDYSLDFNFKDADITHFQYYFAEAKTFNLKKGLVDLDLHLAKDSDTTKGETIWYGQVSARDVDLSPDFLNGMEFNQAEGSITFDSKEATIKQVSALYKNSPFTLKGILTYIDDFNYDLSVKSEDFKLSDLENGLKEHMSLSQEFQAEGKSNLSVEAKIKNEAGVLSLKAEGTVAENNDINLKINTSGINLKELGEILNYKEIKGLADFNGELSGLLDNPKIKGIIKSGRACY